MIESSLARVTPRRPCQPRAWQLPRRAGRWRRPVAAGPLATPFPTPRITRVSKTSTNTGVFSCVRRTRKPFRGVFLRRGFESLPLRLQALCAIRAADTRANCRRPLHWVVALRQRRLEAAASPLRGISFPRRSPEAGVRGCPRPTAQHLRGPLGDRIDPQLDVGLASRLDSRQPRSLAAGPPKRRASGGLDPRRLVRR